MRKVKVKERKTKWSLIVDRSNQRQTTKQRFVSSWAQICSNSEEISVNRPIEFISLITPLPTGQPRFILAILAIGLVIATIFKRVFGLESRDFGGFNNVFNVFVNENKWEKSSLRNNECYFCDVLSSPLNDTIDVAVDTAAIAFNLCPIGVGLAEFAVDGYLFSAGLKAPATVAVVTNENENKMKKQKWTKWTTWTNKYTYTNICTSTSN